MQVKKQLDDELEHLNGSFNQLRAAQAKFVDCLKCIEGGVGGLGEGTSSAVARPQSMAFVAQD